MQKILFVSSEAVPYVKTGGLADVAGSLPRYFDRQEYDVRVILPKYLCISEEFKKQMKFVSHFYMNLGWRKQYVGIFYAKYDGITYYFIDNEFYFAGEGPYNNIYEDVEKFAFFSKAVLEVLPVIDFCPDTIHCHDWQTGLVPVYLDTLYKNKPFYQNIHTIFTIHNMKFQGRWKLKAVRDITGLPEYLFTSDALESYGESNYLKGGVFYSDVVTTVSETYAKEIMTQGGGEGLDGVMRKCRHKLIGIVNGIDYEEFDPSQDDLIFCPYNVRTHVTGKKENKRALQQQLGLFSDDGAMLIGMVSRLTEQKGLALVEYMMDYLLSDGRMQFVVLGTGEARYESMLRYFAEKYPGSISANTYYSDELAHKIYASCDAFLMPSQFEPCGLSQLISYRYGTVPIVRETGGLKDTVIAYNEYENSGTGFSFANYNAHEMRDTILYALNVFRNHKEAWNEIAERGMRLDYSWHKSAQKYAEIYDSLYQRS